jgi:hypothetical protein
MGIKKDTFINYPDTLIITESAVRRLIGICPYIAEIIAYHDKLSKHPKKRTFAQAIELRMNTTLII